MRFTLFGFPVVVRGSFWLTTLVLAFVGSRTTPDLPRVAAWMALVFVSVLVHELGHAFAMRAFGRSPDITLESLGGLTGWGEGERVGAWRRALVSLAGPAAGFLLGVPFAVLAYRHLPADSAFGREFVRMGLWVNVGWGLVNLLPLIPLDGGRVMQAVLVGTLGRTGGVMARWTSLSLGVGALVVAFRFDQLWVAYIALMTVPAAYREQASADVSIPSTRAPEPARSEQADDAPARTWRALWNGDAELAELTARKELGALPDDDAHAPERRALAELLAWARLSLDDVEGAAAVVSTFLGADGGSPLLRARIDLGRGHSPERVAALEAAYRQQRDAMGITVMARVWLEEGKPRRVVEALDEPGGRELSSEVLLRVSAMLFYAAHYEESLAIDQASFRQRNEPVFAYNAACALSRLGRVEEGLQWLERAVRSGFDELASLQTDEDLARLRTSPRFAEVLALAGGVDVTAVRARRLRTPAMIALVGLLFAGGYALWQRYAPRRPSLAAPPVSAVLPAHHGANAYPTPFLGLPDAHPTAEEETLRELFDETCGDVWCEGALQGEFHQLTCDGERCRLGLRLHQRAYAPSLESLVGTESSRGTARVQVVAQGGPVPCASPSAPGATCGWFDVHCTLEGMRSVADLTTVEGYQAVGLCFDAVTAPILSVLGDDSTL